ncbi:MAG TPA: hypothetical protein DER33_07915 [Syntrophomonas sp.]|nr:hypothetical protein [Syntrophomonas sp.]HCF71490.1 hypothetical protein [Syntrophomonas sp.]
MDNIDILNRLVSIKNNAYGLAYDRVQPFPESDYFKIRASGLEYGIDLLIVEIQNAILAERLLNTDEYHQKAVC